MIPANVVKNSYTGNGATAIYSFTFPVFLATDLVVTVLDTFGAVTVLALNVDYTVSAVPAPNGSITLVAGNLTSGNTIIIQRVRPLTQTTDIRNQGNFFPEIHEDTFDNLTMLSQQIQEQVDRALKIAEIDSAGDLTLPLLAARKGQVLGFDPSSGNPVAVQPSSATVSSAMQPVVAAATVASALALLNGIGLAYAAKTSNYTTLDTDVILTGATAGGAFQITLKAAGKPGKFLLIKKTDSSVNALTISDGTLTVTLTVQNEFVCVYDTGAAWLVLFSSTVAPAMESKNVGLAAAVAANAMTISLKTRTGATPSATDPVFIPFRNSTLATGTYVQRSVAAALSTVISSGSTGGSVNAQPNYIWVYAIDNAGSVELAWSGNRIWDEALLYSTTAEGGAGAADDGFTLYSTTARSNVAVKCLGFILSSQSTAGTWASAPTNLSVIGPKHTSPRHEVLVSSGNGYGSTSTKIRRFSSAALNLGTAIGYVQSATAGDSFVIKEAGLYFVSYADFRAGGVTFFGISLNSGSLTTSIDSLTPPENLCMKYNQAGTYGGCSDLKRLVCGDVIRAHGGAADGDAALAQTNFHILKVSD